MYICSLITCNVDNISKTIRDYENLGFTMEWGSDPSRAKNAMLWFEQGPCIEFYKPPNSPGKFAKFIIGAFYGKEAVARIKHYANIPEGWCDAAFISKDHDEFLVDRENRNLLLLKNIVSDLKKMNIPTSKIIKGKRIRADKRKVTYCMVLPSNPEFPILSGGYSFPQRPNSTIHRNGITGIKSIKMEVKKKDMKKFKMIYGDETLLKMESGERTRILEVELDGPKLELNPDFLHGARFT